VEAYNGVGVGILPSEFAGISSNLNVSITVGVVGEISGRFELPNRRFQIVSGRRVHWCYNRIIQVGEGERKFGWRYCS